MEDLTSKQIQEAMERGDFDNLPGTGKPLGWGAEQFVPGHNRLAYKIMKDNDIQPDWIAEQKVIEYDLQQAQKKLLRAKRHFDTAMGLLGGRKDVTSIRQRFDAEDEWKLAQTRFQDDIQAVNHKIKLYNLKVPASHLTRDLLDAAQELHKLL